jgi:hypothetical protein
MTSQVVEAPDGSLKLRLQLTVSVTPWQRRLIRIHLEHRVSGELANLEEIRVFFRCYGMTVGYKVLATLDELWRERLGEGEPVSVEVA